MMGEIIPRIPLAAWIDAFLNWLTGAIAGVTRAIAALMRVGIGRLEDGLLWPPEWVIVILIGLLGWKFGGRKVALGSALGMVFIWNLGLWEPTMSTIALVVLATLIAMLLGLPIGILGGLYETVYQILRPILDFMQTMPAFVYLIPAIPFFGLGAVSALFSTVIFSIPPVIRLTSLGIRQIDRELIEASDAFGSTTMQKLIKVQIPLAKPTIMAGVNQTIMLALSMVVIAAMIGAGGLGGEVWRAIQRLRPGQGFEAGLAVVVVAMILDRITQKIGAAGKAA